MVGGAVGIVTGLIGFIILKKFVHKVTNGDKKAVLLGIVQPFLIIMSLLCCSLLIPDQIFQAGSAAAAVIITGTIISAVRSIRYNRRPEAVSEIAEKEAS